jgi:hypothetical protein
VAVSRDRINWARLALAATGVAGTGVFFMVAFTPYLPIYGDSLSGWAPWALAHQADARHGVAVLFLAYLLYMVFAVYVVTVVRRGDRWTPFLVQVASVAIGVKFTIEMMLIAVLNIPTELGSQDLSDSLAWFGTELSVLSLVPFAVFLLAVGTAALISRALPLWLAWLTLTVGALHTLATVLALTGAYLVGPIQWFLYTFGVVWFMSIPLWPLVASVALIVLAIRRSGPAPEAAVQVQPA